MTAICKTILIHGTNLQNILDYGSDQDKTSVTNNGLENVFDYASNPLKTLANLDDGHKELLVTGVLCQPETALVLSEKNIYPLMMGSVMQALTF